MKIPFDGTVITRAVAIAAGRRFYFTGKPCKNGHVAMRRIHGECIECHRESSSRYSRGQRDVTGKWPKPRDDDYHRKWRAKNIDKAMASERKWRTANPDAVLANNRTRRARKHGASGTHTADDIADIRRLQRDRCATPECRVKLRGGGQVDHIIALSRGGTNDRRNLQILCQPCNARKYTRDPLDLARDNGRFI